MFLISERPLAVNYQIPFILLLDLFLIDMIQKLKVNERSENQNSDFQKALASALTVQPSIVSEFKIE
jgi:hypothetical protein